MLHHYGEHFWMDLPQAVVIERARKALQDAGLTLDPYDETGARWSAVARKPGIYLGVIVIADVETADVISREAKRVFVSVTLVNLFPAGPEADPAMELVLRSIKGSATGPTAAPPAQPVPPASIGYEGNWQVHEGTLHATAEAGAFVEWVFQGTGVRWLGYRFDDAGIAEVRIDGEVVAEVDQYGPGRKLPFAWESGPLPAGTHRIRVTALGRKNPQSTGTHINVIGFEALGADPRR
jgi:hypothetical protein